MRQMIRPLSVFRPIGILAAISFSMLVYSCGSNQTAEVAPAAGTGSVAFSVKWEPPPASAPPGNGTEAAMRPLAPVDACVDYGIQNINFEIFRNGSPSTSEKTYTPVSCWDNSAKLDAVPAGITLFVRITGTGNQGTWTGDSGLFTLSPNEHKTLAPITLTVTEVAAPTFSPPPGTYTEAQSVTLLTTTPNAQIRYTTNGSMPTDNVGTVYTDPISVPASVTIRAVAYLPGGKISAISTGVYTITSPAPRPR